jgi:hypothetical protein
MYFRFNLLIYFFRQRANDRQEAGLNDYINCTSSGTNILCVCVGGGGVVEAKLHENEEGTFARHPDL